MKVPANANVKITPKFLKKFSYTERFSARVSSPLSYHVLSFTQINKRTDPHLFELVPRVQNDRREEKVEEQSVFE